MSAFERITGFLRAIRVAEGSQSDTSSVFRARRSNVVVRSVIVVILILIATFLLKETTFIHVFLHIELAISVTVELHAVVVIVPYTLNIGLGEGVYPNSIISIALFTTPRGGIVGIAYFTGTESKNHRARFNTSFFIVGLLLARDARKHLEGIIRQEPGFLLFPSFTIIISVLAAVIVLFQTTSVSKEFPSDGAARMERSRFAKRRAGAIKCCKESGNSK
mmetsp:Transcript_5404/g.13573  ORF Transcript_5404/g.13573 Transcript_5404/m.13573 type:complete len:220 (-) Transcript_5404:126-785(-)